jgi:hypothetical protein
MGGSESYGCAFVLDILFEQLSVCKSSHREYLENRADQDGRRRGHEPAAVVHP